VVLWIAPAAESGTLCYPSCNGRETMTSDGKARGHQTQWAAQFAVASELCKRGYEVAFTSGHTTPVADLTAVSPVAKTMFLIDVKGLYRPNPWLIKRKPIRDNLFYVLTFVPVGKPNEYFWIRDRFTP